MEWTVRGHDNQKAYVERLIEGAVLGHAYLLAGPEGIGKQLFAEDVVRMLVPQGYELDIARLAPLVDAETGKRRDISIDETTKLMSWTALRPFGTHKAIIIDDADRLGIEAANNLLKILEEPPAYVHFFLVTSHPGQILPTIASRCERVDFQAPVDQQLPPLTAEVRDLAAAVKGTVGQKIAYAKILAENDQASQVVMLLLRHIHATLGEKPHLAPVAHGLLDLSTVLSESHYNRRLAIEHFLLSLPVQK